MSAPHPLLSDTQRAWLDEIGVDLHWLTSGHVAPTPTAPRAEGASADSLAACSDLPALARALQAHAEHAAPALSGPVVLGTGVADRPAYCIIGEQPGLEDEAAGRPFQGDPGRLLQAMLAAVRLPRPESAYFTLVVKQRTAGGRAPAADEILGYLPYLRREIALVQPRCVLALGQVAARAVLDSTAGFDALRGGPHSYEIEPGVAVPVWVTHHPSALLVRSAWKAQAWRDLLALVQALHQA